MRIPNQSVGFSRNSTMIDYNKAINAQLMQRQVNGVSGSACFALCSCCAVPSPVQPECCGACLACKACQLTGWCNSAGNSSAVFS